MKVVLDTNVLVSALISKGGTPAQILHHSAPFELVTAGELLAELERVLHYPHIQNRYQLTEEIISGYLQQLRQASQVVEIQHEIAVVKDDPDDDRFLGCALTVSADYLVSGDAHLLDLGAYEGVTILTPGAFLRVLDSQ